jgi:hypothetical protein
VLVDRVEQEKGKLYKIWFLYNTVETYFLFIIWIS